MKYIFLSYSHRDMDRISYFIRLLSEKHRVIYDTNIGASREYNEELASLIFESSIVVAFISESYLKSSYCLDELLFARENNIPILLVYLEKIDLSNGLRMRLGRFQALSIHSSDIANRIFEIKEVKDCEIKSQSVESEPEEEEHTDGLRSARFLSDLKQNEYIERTDGGWMTDGSWSCAVIPGIRDNTETNKSEPFILDFLKYGHMAVFGIPNCGKSSFVQSILYAAICKYSPEDFQFYIIDLNNCMYDAFRKAPHSGGIISEVTDQRVNSLFFLIDKRLQKRKNLIKNADINQYNSLHTQRIPALLIIIDNFDDLWSGLNDKQQDIAYKALRDGARYGIYLIVINSILRRMSGSFELKKMLNLVFSKIHFNPGTMDLLGLEEETGNDFLSLKRNLPEKWENGTGVFITGDEVFGFHSLLSIDADNVYVRNQLIEQKCEQLLARCDNRVVAEVLPNITENLTIDAFFENEEVCEILKEENLLPVGFDVQTLKVKSINLSKTNNFVIVSKSSFEIEKCISTLLKSIIMKDYKTFYFDREGREALRIENENIWYANTHDTIYELMNTTCIPIIKEVNSTRKQAMKKGMHDEEILRLIKPLFFIIEDYKVFNEILENKSKPSMQGFFENILEKGYLHNIHFIVGTTENKSTSFISRLFELVKRENSGIVLGYPLASQSIIDGPLPFSEQNRIPERGKGNLVLSDYAGIVQIPSLV